MLKGLFCADTGGHAHCFIPTIFPYKSLPWGRGTAIEGQALGSQILDSIKHNHLLQ